MKKHLSKQSTAAEIKNDIAKIMRQYTTQRMHEARM